MPATYCGLDVSDKTTHLCVVDADEKVIWRGVCATDPAALAATLAKRCSGLVRVVLETGPLSAFLYHGLIKRNVPELWIAVGTPIAGRPPHRSGRAAFPHPVPTSGV